MIAALVGDLRQPEYVHVLLNPLPIYGLAVALTGLLIAIFFPSRRGRIVTLILVLVCSAMAWPVAEYGERASDRVLSMSDEDGRAWLEEHEHRADHFVPFFYALAALSLAAILVPIKLPRSSLPLAVATLLFGLVVLGMGGYIAKAGGRIRHREFRYEPPPKEREDKATSADSDK